MAESVLKMYLSWRRTNPRIREYERELKPTVLKLFALMLVEESMVIYIATLGGRLVNEIAAHKYDRAHLLPLLVTILFVVSGRIRRRMSWYRNHFDHGVTAFLKAEAHYKELDLSKEFHDQHGTGDKEAIIHKNMQRVVEIISHVVFVAFPALVRLFSLTLATGLYSFWCLLVSLGTGVIYFLRVWYDSPHMERMSREYNDERESYEKYGSELTHSWRVIQVHGLSTLFCERILARMRSFWYGDDPRHVEWSSRLEMQDLVIHFSRFALWSLMQRLGYYTAMTMGSITVVLSLMERLYSNYGYLSQFQRVVMRNKQAVRTFLEIMLLPSKVESSIDAVTIADPQGKVEFRNVWFQYKPGQNWVLKDVSFTIEPNTVVGIVGPTGSGKTTVAALLERSYDPQRGDILFDGVPLRKLVLFWYRNLIAVVHQQINLFEETIRQNLRMFWPDAPPDAEILAAQDAFAHDFIERQEGGYEARIGSDGVDLSGGQRQRIAIGRALLRDPRLLIFDEATSALDSSSQSEVQRAIDRRTAERKSTTVIIAHRLSTLRKVDKILVMEGGRVVDEGTFEELASRPGIFKDSLEAETKGLSFTAQVNGNGGERSLAGAV